MIFQAADTISDMEQQVDYLKKALKDAEEQRQRQMRVSDALQVLCFCYLSSDSFQKNLLFALCNLYTYICLLFPILLTI